LKLEGVAKDWVKKTSSSSSSPSISYSTSTNKRGYKKDENDTLKSRKNRSTVKRHKSILQQQKQPQQKQQKTEKMVSHQSNKEE